MELTDANLTIFLEDFRDKLQALGDADSIATHLSGLQITAWCGSPGRCAIAVAIKNAVAEEFGQTVKNVCVGSGIFQIMDVAEAVVWYSRHSEVGRTAISRFISRFDVGMYPELVDTVNDEGGRVRVENWNAMSDQARADLDAIYPA